MSSPTLRPLTLALAIGCVVTTHAAQIFLSPTGNDVSGKGTKDLPFFSMERADVAASPGDTVYLRGGIYAITNRANSTCKVGDTVGYATFSTLWKSGTEGKPIRYWAYPGEKPIFDHENFVGKCRHRSVYVRANWIEIKGVTFRNIKQLNARGGGIAITTIASNGRYEQLDMHHIAGMGLAINNGSNNLVLNCDAHHNYDSLDLGESGDGFGVHVPAGAKGNVLRGNRAWENSDDGFDILNSAEAVVVEGNWAWRNGFVPGTQIIAGNGNGFKAGGWSDLTKIPNPIPMHIFRNNLAYNNHRVGFYANHYVGPLLFINNTSFYNMHNYNMLGQTPTLPRKDSSYSIVMNNMSFMPANGHHIEKWAGSTLTTNSWQFATPPDSASFESLDPKGIDGARQADGSLPKLSFLRLKVDSRWMDKGTINANAGYTGKAPDIGAYETTSSAPVTVAPFLPLVTSVYNTTGKFYTIRNAQNFTVRVRAQTLAGKNLSPITSVLPGATWRVPASSQSRLISIGYKGAYKYITLPNGL